jgi:hypothetical protein
MWIHLDWIDLDWIRLDAYETLSHERERVVLECADLVRKGHVFVISLYIRSPDCSVLFSLCFVSFTEHDCSYSICK